MAPNHGRRSRLLYLIVTSLVIVLGLASRRYRATLSPAIGLYAGDTLWATAVFLLLAVIWPVWSTTRLAVCSGLFAFAIEMSQLYHASWLEGVRYTRLGGLVLGYDFLWIDLLCYALGIAAAALLDVILRARHAHPHALAC